MFTSKLCALRRLFIYGLSLYSPRAALCLNWPWLFSLTERTYSQICLLYSSLRKENTSEYCFRIHATTISLLSKMEHICDTLLYVMYVCTSFASKLAVIIHYMMCVTCTSWHWHFHFCYKLGARVLFEVTVLCQILHKWSVWISIKQLTCRITLWVSFWHSLNIWLNVVPMTDEGMEVECLCLSVCSSYVTDDYVTLHVISPQMSPTRPFLILGNAHKPYLAVWFTDKRGLK